jgi:hypothetical protein
MFNACGSKKFTNKKALRPFWLFWVKRHNCPWYGYQAITASRAAEASLTPFPLNLKLPFVDAVAFTECMRFTVVIYRAVHSVTLCPVETISSPATTHYF